MAHTATLKAEVRERAGKGAARATRRAGRVPAVIYGKEFTPVLVSLDPLELTQQLRGPGFFTRVLALSVNGETHRVLARDLQVDPVTDRPVHVDFLRFSADTMITIEVPVVFENEEESTGLKQGGVLNVVRHAVELVCAPDKIPETISVDLTGLDIGDSIHISDVALPKGVEPTITDRDFTIATIAAPTRLLTPEEEEAEAAAVEGVAEALAEEEEAETPEAAGEGEEGGGGEDKSGD